MTTTSNPQTAVVSAEVDLHSVINALVELAEKYPAERLSYEQAHAVQKAGDMIFDRVYDFEHPERVAARTEGFNGKMPKYF